MDDLMDLINAQDELTQVEYKIARLRMIEEEYVENEEYEKAQLILNEQKRLRRRRTILKIGEFYKPSILEVHLLNGDISHVKIDKQNTYSCPISCGAIHHHNAVITKEIGNYKKLGKTPGKDKKSGKSTIVQHIKKNNVVKYCENIANQFIVKDKKFFLKWDQLEDLLFYIIKRNS